MRLVQIRVTFAKAGWYLMSARIRKPRALPVISAWNRATSWDWKTRTRANLCLMKNSAIAVGISRELLISSVRCHIAFGTFPKWAGMPAGHLFLRARHISEPALKPASLLYRHVSQRKISFVLDGKVHVARETGELVAYREIPLSSVLPLDGTSQIRTSQLVKLDASGNPTTGEAAFYDEVMADSSVVRYDAMSRKPVHFVTSAGVLVTAEEMKAELDIVHQSGLRQFFTRRTG